ncbi:MAG TPA: flagellar FliJ family protein [Povalibacter sp.]|uniref:flagellar FliJ family protein n=1 Tax=Povalibacter sp. TaxID=1962978 RepID=UPI002C0A89B4|nr:flagellar FliJ family protein [Povalibacter sp.]HMN43152.1 flagellar FliJ family protein [Povalibacter sp.]
MSGHRKLQRLGRLVDLREREVERLSAEMADKRIVRQRYLDNLARLEQLCESSGQSGAQALSPTLSLNVGGYKQAVMKMADAHRLDLSLHEAQMQTTQRLMTVAAQRHEALDQVLVRQRRGVQRFQNAREQKRQDELAAQVWLRGRK